MSEFAFLPGKTLFKRSFRGQQNSPPPNTRGAKKSVKRVKSTSFCGSEPWIPRKPKVNPRDVIISSTKKARVWSWENAKVLPREEDTAISTSNASTLPTPVSYSTPKVQSTADHLLHHVSGQEQAHQSSSMPAGLSIETSNKFFAMARRFREVKQRRFSLPAKGRQSGNDSKEIVIKVAMVGDAAIGKTTMMTRYVEGEDKLNSEYIETLGVNFMEKTVTLKSTKVTFSIWDLGGQAEFRAMLPLLCNDAAAVIFMFDLSNPSTLGNLKEWYRQVRLLNKDAVAMLVGSKYDLYLDQLSERERADVDRQASRFAKAMRASLVYSCSPFSINVNAIFKVLLAKVLGVKCNVPRIDKQGDPLLLY